MPLSALQILPELGAAIAVLVYLELRVTRAVKRETYVIEQAIHDRRSTPPRASDPKRRITDWARARSQRIP